MRRFGFHFLLFVLFFSFQTSILATAEENAEEYLIVEGGHSGIVDFMKKKNIPVVREYDTFSIISTTLTDKDIQMLQSNFPSIKIQENRTYEQSNNQKMSSIKTVNATSSVTSPYTGRGVKVAVLDSGIDVNHPDLQVKGGYCSLPLDCPNRIPYNDDNGHGTHVAGIIAAVNYDKGIIGIAPNVDLYSIKSLNAFGYGSTDSLIAGIEWAIQNKMDILNMSITTDKSDVALEKALKFAYDQGILIVGSAGNNGDSTDKTVRYPAKYNSVIAVSAITPDLTKLRESAVGNEVDITAPGGNVFSTYPISQDFLDGKVDGYTSLSGTSMATPHVTGILALYKERYPTKTNVELRQLITNNAKDLGPKGKDPIFGHGLIQYVPILPGTITFNTKAENGKISLTTKESTVSIQANGKRINPQNGQWILYGVKGEKEVLVTSTQNGKSLVERQYINLNSPAYRDVSNRQPFSGAIGFMSHHRQITGFNDGTYRPYTNITRGEAAVLIGRALDYSSAPVPTPFSDVPESSFASGYITQAVSEKIITGFSDGTFRPEAYVTRAEMAILISKAYGLKGEQSQRFTDVTPSMASYDSISALSMSGITTGYSDGRFKPYDQMTRGDFAVFLARAQNDLFK